MACFALKLMAQVSSLLFNLFDSRLGPGIVTQAVESGAGFFPRCNLLAGRVLCALLQFS
jgi:hypothetical protein